MVLNQNETPNSIYMSLRSRLIAGEFASGNRLKPDTLKEIYGCSASTVREILVRLSADGIVSMEEQRGFRVPDSSERRLRELTHLRQLLEIEGAAMSILNGDLEWEARLTAAHHKLAHVEHKMTNKSDIEPFVSVWTKCDWEFHDTLMSACGSDLLRQTHRNTYDRFRQQVVAELRSFGFRNETVLEHKAVLDAALARDSALCADKLKSHLRVYRDKNDTRVRAPEPAGNHLAYE